MTTSHESPPSGVPEPNSGSNQRRILLVALGTVIAAVIAVVVVVSTGGSGEPKFITLVQVQPVRIAGEPLPTPEAGAADNSLGRSVPRIDGKTFGSRSIAIKPGKPTLVVAINRADPDVQAEVEALVQWHHADLTPEELIVITLVTGPDRDSAADPVSSWLVREEWPFPVLVDDAASSAAGALGLLATPAFLIVGTDGIVRFRALGALPIDRLVLELKNQLGL
ncbi:MAG: hypothetical protein F2934_02935 [Actinobacteria bacterium]|uniref:Unannotated protein n=1 Tax=freshwater metagenome TaxID=449393 RepID=A0A6J7D050_9ZZZZ|nr:hypothetical protein [Actinomycetota bacterium]MSY12196.1 hypothetical protein [Actinomycetota bacterium]MSZ04080.1 hypothetical protein [Actinomycetota bacterium]MTB06070.1 hypothetical protein [Actinomycetota bacterium]